MIQLERGNSLLNGVQFRSPIADSEDVVKVEPSLVSGGGENVNIGISQSLFERFKDEHPNSDYPLIDFLREFPQEQVSFDDISQNFGDIGDLYSNDKFWVDYFGKQYLRIKDIAVLFVSLNGRQKSLEDKSWFMNAIVDLLDEWQIKSKNKYHYINIPGHQTNNYYEKDAVSDFLFFILDRNSLRHNGVGKDELTIGFADWEKFNPVRRRVKVRKINSERPVDEESDLTHTSSILGKNLWKWHVDRLRKILEMKESFWNNATNNWLYSKAIELSELPSFNRMIFENRQKYARLIEIESEPTVILPLENLTANLVWDNLDEKQLSSFERNTAAAKIFNNLWRAVYKDRELRYIEIENENGLFLIWEDFINLAWMFYKTSRMKEFYSSVVLTKRDKVRMKVFDSDSYKTIKKHTIIK